MFAKKKEVVEIIENSELKNKKVDKYPIRFSLNYIKEQQAKLEEKNLTTLRVVHDTNEEFLQLQDGMGALTKGVNSLKQTFENIISVSTHFSEVESSIGHSVDKAQNQVNVLKKDSVDVSESFKKMQETFQVLLNSVDKIKERTEEIVAVANQTNLLALNASIEAARAGEQGRGFSVVAEEVKVLAEGIKHLVSNVNESIQEVETSTGELNASLQNSKKVLDSSVQNVEQTHEIFDQIKESASQTGVVRKDIEEAVSDSQIHVKEIEDYIENSVKTYDEILENMEEINEEDSKKGVLLEEFNNMLEQIMPMVEEL